MSPIAFIRVAYHWRKVAIGVIATSVGQIDKSPLITQDDRRKIEEFDV